MSEIKRHFEVRPVWTILFGLWVTTGAVLLVLIYVYLYRLNPTVEKAFYSAAILNGGIGLTSLVPGTLDDQIRNSLGNILAFTFSLPVLGLGIFGYIALFYIP